MASKAAESPTSKKRRGDRRLTTATPPETVPVKDRRAQLVAAAAHLFAEYGFETASMRQIAMKVDLIAGSIYHHFSTKEEILHQIIRDPLTRLMNDAEYIGAMPVDAEVRLVTLILSRLNEYVFNWEANAIVLQESQFLRRTEDFAYVTEIKQRTFRVHEQILNDGMGSGLFHDGIDTYLMIGTIARMLSSAAAWFHRGDIFSSETPARYTFDRVVDFHLDAVLRMVRTPARLELRIPRELCERLARPSNAAAK
jgi:AcrR family transcriptional regulator